MASFLLMMYQLQNGGLVFAVLIRLLKSKRLHKSVHLTFVSMKKICTILLPILILFSCKKDVTELPSATQSGANIFGAKVNGEFWVPQGFGPFPANDKLTSQLFPNGDLRIIAKNIASSPNESEFDMFVTGVTGTGIYLLNNDVSYPSLIKGYGYFVRRKLTPTNEWITSSTNTGTVTITRFDPANHIVSGTFQFNAGSLYTPGNILSVTEGRFDLTTQ